LWWGWDGSVPLKDMNLVISYSTWVIMPLGPCMVVDLHALIDTDIIGMEV
jgi:hypothetical protein